MRRITVLKMIAAILISFIGIQAYADEADAHWTYTGKTGVDYWGKLDPSFSLCATGKTQSPINIQHPQPGKNTLALQYDPEALIIEVDGPTDLFIHGKETITNTGHGVQLNFDAQEGMTFADKKYHLVQFHFHTPAENVMDNKTYPMEIHFVHQSDNGDLAVIAVFVTKGAENPAIEEIIKNIPSTEKIPVTVKGERINPIDLMPQDKNYYQFAGSLTTPPCTEGLDWLVLKGTISASAQQIAKLKAASHGENARPIQPLNKRKIFYTG
jgi:carbonic anhydrase